jgi:hypothetical protein
MCARLALIMSCRIVQVYAASHRQTTLCNLQGMLNSGICTQGYMPYVRGDGGMGGFARLRQVWLVMEHFTLPGHT